MNRAFSAMAGAVVVALAVSALVTSPAVAVAAPAPSAPVMSAQTVVQVETVAQVKTAFIPEWYQYCANTRPIGITQGKSGYMNAYSSRSGVTCQWWVAPWGAGFPHTVKKSYSWDTVCRYYRSTFSTFKNNYPWCR